MGIRSFPGVKYGRGVMLTTHPLLVPWEWKSRAILLTALWAPTGPVTGTLYLFYYSEVYKQRCFRQVISGSKYKLFTFIDVYS
jgi:hypothetical protein